MVKSSGVEIEQGLELSPPGVWHFSVKDNNGYHLGFSETTRRK